MQMEVSALWGRMFERLATPYSPRAAATSAPHASLRGPRCNEVRLSSLRRDLLLRAAGGLHISVTDGARDRSHATRLRKAALALQDAGYVELTRGVGTGVDGRHCWRRLALRLTPVGEALVSRTRRQLDKGLEVRWRDLRQTGLTLPYSQLLNIDKSKFKIASSEQSAG